MKFRVMIEMDEDGMFVAECPTLPGCVSQGNTRGEALVQIKDAIAGYLFSLARRDEPVPLPIHDRQPHDLAPPITVDGARPPPELAEGTLRSSFAMPGSAGAVCELLLMQPAK